LFRIVNKIIVFAEGLAEKSSLSQQGLKNSINLPKKLLKVTSLRHIFLRKKRKNLSEQRNFWINTIIYMYVHAN